MCLVQEMVTPLDASLSVLASASEFLLLMISGDCYLLCLLASSRLPVRVVSEYLTFTSSREII